MASRAIDQPPGGQIVFAGGYRPSTPCTSRMLAIGAIVGIALSFIASQPAVKVVATAAFTAAKVLCVAHPIATAIVAGVIVVAALAMVVKYAQHQHAQTKLNRDFLNIARGWHTEREVRNKRADKEEFTILGRPHPVEMHEQGIKDINRPGSTHVSIGTHEFPPPPLPLTGSNNLEERGKRQLEHEERIRGIFTELQTLIPGLSDERAAEVITLLLAQTVQGQLWGVLCKRLGSDYNPPQQDCRIPRKYSIQINDRNEVVLTTEVLFKTQLIENPEDVDHHQQYVIKTEMRIPKETLLTKSMEELTSKDFAVAYQIARLGA